MTDARPGPVGSAIPMVEARGVHKAYGRLEVLQGIDMKIPRKKNLKI